MTGDPGKFVLSVTHSDRKELLHFWWERGGAPTLHHEFIRMAEFVNRTKSTANEIPSATKITFAGTGTSSCGSPVTRHFGPSGEYQPSRWRCEPREQWS
jgi:hypothetical protein